MGFYFVMYVRVGVFMGVAARISTLRRAAFHSLTGDTLRR